MGKYNKRLEKPLSASYWGERVRLPIYMGSTKPIDWMHFNSESWHTMMIEEEHLIFDLSKLVPKKLFENCKTDKPEDKWMGEVEMNKFIKPICDDIIDDIIDYLEGHLPENRLVTVHIDATYFWIETIKDE